MEGPGLKKMEGPRSREHGMGPALGKTRGLDAKELQILGSVISGGRYGLFVTLHAVLVGRCGSSN